MNTRTLWWSAVLGGAFAAILSACKGSVSAGEGSGGNGADSYDGYDDCGCGCGGGCEPDTPPCAESCAEAIYDGAEYCGISNAYYDLLTCADGLCPTECSSVGQEYPGYVTSECDDCLAIECSAELTDCFNEI